MRKLRTLALAGVLGACMLAPTRADDDDIQVPNVLNAPPASAVIAYAEPVIAITHVRVADGTGAAAREDQTVVIDHGKIRAFGAAAGTVVPAGAKVVDGSGDTLTPGFVGTHDHLSRRRPAHAGSGSHRLRLDHRGLGDQRDMELLVEAGLTPLEAIHVATQNGALALGRERSIGTVAIGKNADLVLICGNPAVKIDDVENVVTVFKDGVGYDSAKLLASVRGKVGRQ